MMAQYLKINFMRCTNYVQNFVFLSESAQFFAMPPHYNESTIKCTLLSHQQNGIFVNRMRFLLLCEKSGVILLVLVSLTAGRLTVRQILVDLKIYNILYRSLVRIFTEFNEGMYSVIIVLPMHFSWFFG